MANEGVKIPVSVTGGEKAAKDLGKVGEAVELVELKAWHAAAAQEEQAAAAVKAGKSQEESAKQNQKAGDALFDFHKKGEKVVKGILADINPALANMADLFLDVAEGASHVTGPLVAIAGIGAAVGVVSAALSHAAKEAAALEQRLIRAMEAAKNLRDEGLSVRASIAEGAAKAGVFGGGDQSLRDVAEMMSRGVPRELAVNAAIAQRIAEAEGAAFDREKFLAGLMVGGAEPVDLTGARPDVSRRIGQVQQAGAAPEAAAALRSFIAEVGEQARREAPPEAARRIDTEERIDTAVAEYARRNPALNERELQVIRQFVTDNIGTAQKAVERLPEFKGAGSWLYDLGAKVGMRSAGWFPDETAESIIARAEAERRGYPIAPGGATIGALLDAAQEIRRMVGARGPGAGEGPIVVNVQEFVQHKEQVQQKTNVATQVINGVDPANIGRSGRPAEFELAEPAVR